jgi:hypothetical protein
VSKSNWDSVCLVVAKTRFIGAEFYFLKRWREIIETEYQHYIFSKIKRLKHKQVFTSNL